MALVDAKRFGASDAALEKIRASFRQGDPLIDLWADNLDAALAFAAASTQWRTAATAGRLIWLGLDYAGARAGIEAAGLTLTPAIWSDLRTMEAEAMTALNERKF